MVSATDENGIVRENVYDLAGNLIQSIDGLTYYEEFTYDAGNRLIQKTDRNGNTTTYNHDIMGRLLQEVDALGNYTSFAYDYLGRVTSTTDKNGNTTQYILDKNGNITQTTDALGGISLFIYDAMNRLVQVKQGLAQEQITAYNYDYRGLLTSETNPLGMSKTYQDYSYIWTAWQAAPGSRAPIDGVMLSPWHRKPIVDDPEIGMMLYAWPLNELQGYVNGVIGSISQAFYH